MWVLKNTNNNAILGFFHISMILILLTKYVSNFIVTSYSASSLFIAVNTTPHCLNKYPSRGSKSFMTVFCLKG